MQDLSRCRDEVVRHGLIRGEIPRPMASQWFELYSTAVSHLQRHCFCRAVKQAEQRKQEQASQAEQAQQKDAREYF
jgi:hypothetical protein